MRSHFAVMKSHSIYLFYRRHQNTVSVYILYCHVIGFQIHFKRRFFCSLKVSEMSGKATWPPEKGSPVLLYHLIGTTVHHSNVASLCALGAILISWIVPPNMTSQTSHESGWIVSTSLSYRKTWKNLKAKIQSFPFAGVSVTSRQMVRDTGDAPGVWCCVWVMKAS